MNYFRILMRSFLVAWPIAGSLLFAVTQHSLGYLVISFFFNLVLVAVLIHGTNFFATKQEEKHPVYLSASEKETDLRDIIGPTYTRG